MFSLISLLRFKNITILSLRLACQSAQLMNKKCKNRYKKIYPSNQKLMEIKCKKLV